MADQEKSLTWIVVVVMAGIAIFGWGFLAGSYEGAHTAKVSEMSEVDRMELEGRPPRSVRAVAVVAFFANAVRQLPKLPEVISWHMSHRIWLPILIVVLEVCALIGGIGLKKLEKSLKKPGYRRR